MLICIDLAWYKVKYHLQKIQGHWCIINATNIMWRRCLISPNVTQLPCLKKTYNLFGDIWKSGRVTKNNIPRSLHKSCQVVPERFIYFTFRNPWNKSIRKIIPTPWDLKCQCCTHQKCQTWNLFSMFCLVFKLCFYRKRQTKHLHPRLGWILDLVENNVPFLSLTVGLKSIVVLRSTRFKHVENSNKLGPEWKKKTCYIHWNGIPTTWHKS